MTTSQMRSAYQVPVLLADGAVALVREVSPEDRQGLYNLHDHASDETVRFRFFTLDRTAGRRYVDRLCDQPAGTVFALLVELYGSIVALGTAEPSGPDQAEVSFFVSDAEQGHGVGTLLLEHLAALARSSGVHRFVAEILPSNASMLKVFLHAGFEITAEHRLGEITLTMDTSATERAVQAADARERTAEAASLQPLLRPRGIAVAGVGHEHHSIGRAVLGNLLASGHAGPVFVLHPTATEVLGVKAAPSVAALPQIPDLLIVAVPAPSVHAVVEEAATSGVRAAVIISSGFRESGPAGRVQETALVTTARSQGMRLVGPNCFGVLGLHEECRFDATFAALSPISGGLAIASQSGGVGISLLSAAVRHDLGVRFFVSLGNKADVSGNDLIAAWTDDPEVHAAVLYLESFGNARKFARLARNFSERKPLVMIVGGGSDGGRRAGMSHTAAAAVPDAAVEALCTHTGALRVHDLADLSAIASTLTQRLPKGPRVVIIGNAGGLGILVADACPGQGLVTPRLSESTSSRIRAATNAAGTSNPVDLGAAASADAYHTAITAVWENDQADTLLVVHAATRVSDTPAVLAGIDRALTEREIPAAVVCTGATAVPARLPGGVPVFSSLRDAVTGIAGLTRYAAWRHAPRGRAIPRCDRDTAETSRKLAADMLQGASERWLSTLESAELLSRHSVELVGGTIVHTPEEAAAAAREVHGPVVLKSADPHIVHKSDLGLVQTGLRTSAEVTAAYTRLVSALPSDDTRLLLQPQATGVAELAVGVVRDPGFGPLVMVAAGGVHTDVWDDRVFLMPPVTDLDVSRALRTLRIWPLLAGHRGSPPAAVAALEQLVQRVAALAEDLPHIAELDLNPVIVDVTSVACVDAKMRLAIPVAVDSQAVHFLREPS